MERSTRERIVYGAVGGLLAGTVVVLWFVVVDVIAGEPFQTPARLASAILGEQFHGAWPRLIAVYTILHFGVFAALGALAATALGALGLDPGLTVGALFGGGVLNAVHYGSLLTTGANLLTIVPAAHVFAANVLGGMVMMAYLHRATAARSPFGWNVLRSHAVVYHGVVTGAVGAVTVALWLFVVDVARGRPFHTPAALASAILLGGTDAAAVQPHPGVLLAYSVLHLGGFALVGVAFAWLVARGREGGAAFPWVQGAVVLGLLEAIFFGSVAMVNGWVVTEVGWLALVVANGLAVVSMGLWLRRVSTELRHAGRGDSVSATA